MITVADHKVFILFCSAKWNKTLLHSKWQFTVSSSSPPLLLACSVLFCSGSSAIRRWKIMFNLLIKVFARSRWWCPSVRSSLFLLPHDSWSLLADNNGHCCCFFFILCYRSSAIQLTELQLNNKESYYHATLTIQQKMSLPKWPIRLLDRWTDEDWSIDT